MINLTDINRRNTFIKIKVVGINTGDKNFSGGLAALNCLLEKNLPGVTITLQPVTKAEYLSKTFNDDYDIAVVNWIADYNDPMGFLMLWTTENCEVAEHWSNAEYDRLIAECTTGALAANYSARWQALHDAEKIMLQEAVIAPLYTGAETLLISDDVSGIEFHPAGVMRIYKHAVLNRSIVAGSIDR